MPLSQQAKDTAWQWLMGYVAELPEGHFLRFAGYRPMIYGMDGPQREYLHFLLNAQQDYEERDVERFPKANHPFVSNYYIDWTNQAEVGGTGTRRRALRWDMTADDMPQELERRRLARQFESSSLAVGSLMQRDLQQQPARTQKIVKGVRKDRPDLAPTIDDIVDERFDHQIKQFSVRRGCKFLIYSSVRDGRKVTYALDDLEMGDVVSKQARQLDNGRFKVPVCTSELREIFRRWDVLDGDVFFFRDLMRVPPPWNPHAPLDELQGWSAYAAARAAKLQATLPAQSPLAASLAQVATYHQQGRFAWAVGQYHASHPSALSPPPTAVWD